MICVFGNKEQLVYTECLDSEEFFNGSSRRTLTFTCEPDAISIDTLNEILSDEENVKSLELHGALYDIDAEGNTVERPVTNIYDGYVLKLKVGIEEKMIDTETPEHPAQYADKLVFKLGRRTYIEEQLHKLGIG